MSEQRAKRILAVVLIWLLVLAAAVALWRFFVVPAREDSRNRSTTTPSRYDTTLRIAHDSFSGYAILRSPTVREAMKDLGVRLEFEDDRADYASRIRQLADGETHAAVFTVDALLRACADLGEFPGTIVLVIDETRGADAVVAWEKGVPELSVLDHAEARVLATPDSPSDTLARVLYDQFSISAPVDTWLEGAGTVEEVYRRLLRASPDARRAFVLWEPFVTQAREQDGIHVLLDTAALKGYIVDVLVVGRDFLQEERGTVQALIEAYLRAAFEARMLGGMPELVAADAREMGAPLDSAQVASLIQGVHWKNTLENYAHFGILPENEAQGVVHLEDMIRNLSRVLVATGVLERPPLEDREGFLFYDGILRGLHAADFHPGRGETNGGKLETLDPIRRESALRELTDAQWDSLAPVGTLRVDPIRFARGSARLNLSSERALAAIAERLESFPYAYLVVAGQARREGDPEANRLLADQRARAAMAELMRLGVPAARLRALTRESRVGGGAAQSVSFELGQLPY